MKTQEVHNVNFFHMSSFENFIFSRICILFIFIKRRYLCSTCVFQTSSKLHAIIWSKTNHHICFLRGFCCCCFFPPQFLYFLGTRYFSMQPIIFKHWISYLFSYSIWSAKLNKCFMLWSSIFFFFFETLNWSGICILKAPNNCFVCLDIFVSGLPLMIVIDNVIGIVHCLLDIDFTTIL